MPKSLGVERYIAAQVKYWQQQKEKLDLPDRKKTRHFITISREYGCRAVEIGNEIVEMINCKEECVPPWAVYDRQVLDRVMEDMGITSSLAKTLTDESRNLMKEVLETSFSSYPPQVAVYRKLAETIRLLAANGNVVIVGRAGNVITREMEGGYNVMIVASMDYKIKNVRKHKNISRKEAEKLINENTEKRISYIKEYVNFDVADPHNYDITINLSKNTIKEAAQLIIEGMKIKGFL